MFTVAAILYIQLLILFKFWSMFTLYFKYNLQILLNAIYIYRRAGKKTLLNHAAC